MDKDLGKRLINFTVEVGKRELVNKRNGEGEIKS